MLYAKHQVPLEHLLLHYIMHAYSALPPSPRCPRRTVPGVLSKR